MSKDDQIRDLDADLAICEAATEGPWALNAQYDLLLDGGGRTLGFLEAAADREFTIAARTGWPAAIRRAMAAEVEIERLQKVRAEEHERYRNQPFD